MSSQGNAGGGGAEDPEATEVDDLGVDAREAGGAHAVLRVCRSKWQPSADSTCSGVSVWSDIRAVRTKGSASGPTGGAAQYTRT